MSRLIIFVWFMHVSVENQAQNGWQVSARSSFCVVLTTEPREAPLELPRFGISLRESSRLHLPDEH